MGQRLDPKAFGPEPAFRVSYDEAAKVQHFVVQGLISRKKMDQLKKDNPSQLLVKLLNAVQNQAKAFIQELRVNRLSTSDFDPLFGRFDGLTDLTGERRLELLKALLPYLHRTLTRQGVVQTLATSLNADLSLTEALIFSLLTDPGEPGRSLLRAFVSAGERGVSAIFFNATDDTLKTITMASTDTALQDDNKRPLKPDDAQSARFEGYVEVPVAGAYRFFVVFGKKDAEAEVRFGHLPEPLLKGKAANDRAEISQFVELKAGVPYRFTFDAQNLGSGDIQLLVQGENLPKGSLARLMLYPEAAVGRVHRAYVLLAKTLQLIQGFGFSEREVRHMLTHAADFDHLDLSKLPTREADDTPAGATTLFGQFLRLIDYARLKRDVAGGSDDLIGIFENARHTFKHPPDKTQPDTDSSVPPWQRLAELTRRDVSTVLDVARHLGFVEQLDPANTSLLTANEGFANEKGIERLWEALQVVEKLGVPVDAIIHWATSDPDFDIARDLKNTVKARYKPENWQRIAQPIFDKLRQRQRDALVAYVVHHHEEGFESINQLFEYFLIDPGMEPVVQTSRIRLAISSVQLFIHRCLMNLEPQVHPSAINSKHWQWMQRYRVWEANRKGFFLFPENLLEPEFRDDKSHLFQELESALLQGDVSNELAEDAFFNYLKKLEELARLDIVTMYCEEKPDPDSNVLHVIGRTFNVAHKYFYRRYAHRMWTPWEPVTVEIEGDHVVAVVWRERLHLFWVTFMEKAKPSGGTDGSNFEDIAKQEPSDTVIKLVEVQLNWSEYFQGQWTTRESGGFSDPVSVDVPNDFNSREVFIHATKENDGDGEGAIRVHLSFKRSIVQIPILEPRAGNRLSPVKLTQIDVERKEVSVDKAFRVVSKNSLPETNGGQAPQKPPYLYSDSVNAATRHKGSGTLQVTLKEETENGIVKPPTTVEPIIKPGGSFSLLLCNDPIDAKTQEEIERKALESPFFFQDEQHTFFVEPTLHSVSVNEWDGYGITFFLPPIIELVEDRIPITPEVPTRTLIDPIDPHARFEIVRANDWLTDTATVLQYDAALVGQGGRLDLAVLPSTTRVGDAGSMVNVTPGSELPPGTAVVAPSRDALTPTALTHPAAPLNVVGGSGLNPALLENLDARGLNLAEAVPAGALVRNLRTRET